MFKAASIAKRNETKPSVIAANKIKTDALLSPCFVPWLEVAVSCAQKRAYARETKGFHI
jgi:hypothetical protein